MMMMMMMSHHGNSDTIWQTSMEDESQLPSTKYQCSLVCTQTIADMLSHQQPHFYRFQWFSFLSFHNILNSCVICVSPYHHRVARSLEAIVTARHEVRLMASSKAS